MSKLLSINAMPRIIVALENKFFDDLLENTLCPPPESPASESLLVF